MVYPRDLHDLSKEEKLRYYKQLAQLSTEERREERRARHEEMRELGMGNVEIITILDGEEIEAREMLHDEKIKERTEKKMAKESKETWGEDSDKDIIEDKEELEQPSIKVPDNADFLQMKQKTEAEQDNYIKTLIRKEKTQDIIKGLTGFGSRDPVKEVLEEGAEKVLSGVVSGAKKLATAIKGKPKTPAELREERLSKSKVVYKESRGRGRSIISRLDDEPEERAPSLKDIGKGSLGAERYEPYQPNFFGSSNDFIMGGKSPIGEPTREKRPSKPPATHIPFGGKKAPETKIPSGGSRPPSTSFPGRLSLPETRVQFREKAPSTRVPIIKERPPKVGFRGAKKVSTRVPEGKKKAPVILKKAGKPISTRIGKPQKVKTNVPQQEDAVDVLGLKGFW